MKVKLSAIAMSMVLFAGVGYAQEQDPVHIEPRVPEKAPKKGRLRAVAPSATDSASAAEETAGPLMPGESSSRDTKIDLSPPKDEGNAYPESEAEGDVRETHAWDPHKAQKDIEVGDYYAHRGNLKAALARYESALTFQDNNEDALWKAGQAAEKLGEKQKALRHYRDYLTMLPKGVRKDQVEKAMARLDQKPS